MLLDYMLPDINGNVVCQAVKRNPELVSTKIIIVSGVVNQSEIDELLNSGAEDFIRKPFDISDLVEKIVGVLQMK
jgi:DNA-binding response OmpR family regulator